MAHKIHGMNPVADIKRRARKHGLFMSAVCAEAGIHPSQASRWLRGHARPLYESIEALEEALERLVLDLPAAREQGEAPRID
jgi:transcriptional regulator with XRE-family HTH domain